MMDSCISSSLVYRNFDFESESVGCVSLIRSRIDRVALMILSNDKNTFMEEEKKRLVFWRSAKSFCDNLILKSGTSSIQ